MKNFKVLVAAGVVGVMLLCFTPLAEAHVINGTPTANCNIVNGNFSSFPNGTNPITLTVGTHSAVQSFHGTSGSVTYSWTSLGVNTALGGTISYKFSWSVDGGGTAGPYTFNAAVCHTTTPTTVPVPPTTVVPPTTTPPVTPPTVPAPVTTTPPPVVAVPPATTPPVVVTTAPPTAAPVVTPPAPVKKHHHKTVKPKPVPKKSPPKGIPIPSAHTGEPWASPVYFVLLGLLMCLGVFLVVGNTLVSRRQKS